MKYLFTLLLISFSCSIFAQENRWYVANDANNIFIEFHKSDVIVLGFIDKQNNTRILDTVNYYIRDKHIVIRDLNKIIHNDTIIKFTKNELVIGGTLYCKDIKTSYY